MFASNLRRERAMGNLLPSLPDGRRMDLALPIPTIQCKCQRPTEDRRRESQFREFPVSARRASQDRRLYGRTSVVVVGRIPLSGSQKWPEMSGGHTSSEPIVRSGNTPKKCLTKGPYLNDVYTEGGLTKCRRSKGGCVDSVLWILPKCRQGGRGSKIPKIV